MTAAKTDFEDDSSVLVTVFCLVYNHEKYVSDALEGFVRQKTNFPFEVLVHDDASTDSSAQIIEDYCKRYPDILIPIIEKENQYSQGVKIGREIMLPRARGKYFAFCEGDDYWTDDSKLQEQIDFLESHPEYSACAHNSLQLNVSTGKSSVMFPSETFDLSMEEVIRTGGLCWQTASLVCRRSAYETIPDFLRRQWVLRDRSKGLRATKPPTSSIYRYHR